MQPFRFEFYQYDAEWQCIFIRVQQVERLRLSLPREKQQLTVQPGSVFLILLPIGANIILRISDGEQIVLHVFYLFNSLAPIGNIMSFFSRWTTECIVPISSTTYFLLFHSVFAHYLFFFIKE